MHIRAVERGKLGVGLGGPAGSAAVNHCPTWTSWEEAVMPAGSWSAGSSRGRSIRNTSPLPPSSSSCASIPAARATRSSPLDLMQQPSIGTEQHQRQSQMSLLFSPCGKRQLGGPVACLKDQSRCGCQGGMTAQRHLGRRREPPGVFGPVSLASRAVTTRSFSLP